MRLYISPKFPKKDHGEGGIRRIVEAQCKYLPEFGINITGNIQEADMAAFHAAEWERIPENMPVVAHLHGLHWADFDWPNKWFSHVNNLLIRNMKQADVVTAPSEWVAQAIRRGMWIDPVVLYHGVEPDEWSGSNKHEDYVLWNKTRVDPVCDPTPLLELAKRAPDQRFVSTFVSDDNIPAPPNIEIVGRESYSDAKERVKNARIYLATAKETFGIGTVEAMASGVPVLGFAWGGQPEIVIHQEHGYLAEPDDYDDLAIGLDYINQHYTYLSHNARERAFKHFTWRHWIEQYAKLYKDLYTRKITQPKVSVVITNYNLGKYLPRAVASAQSACVGIKHEILVIDDASTEPLPELPLDIKIIRNPENLHISGALNVGLELAQGEYFVSLDADNLLTKNFKILVDALDQDRSLDIAYGKMQVFNEAGNKYISNWPPKEASHYKQISHENQITSTALYRKKIADRVGGYRRRCKLGEDADFWCRALSVGAKASRVTDLVTLEYMDRPDSVSHVIKNWDWHKWYWWTGGQHTLWPLGGPIYAFDKPVISVIIPVGPGHEEYLLDALDSVQAQSLSFYKWEAIVINDTGRSLKRTQPWAKVYSGGRKGVSHARNRGVDLSRGEYVLFLDADDYLHPDALYHMYNTAVTANCPKLFVYSDWFVAETGEVKHAPEFRPEDVYRRPTFPVTCLYKRDDIVSDLVRWDESFTSGWEDWDYSIQAVAKAGLCGVRVPAPLLHYRTKSGSLRTKAHANSDQVKIRLNDKWSDFISGKTPNRSESMGCGGCGGGSRYPSLYSNYKPERVFDDVDIEKDTSLVEYTPPEDWTGTRAFLGRVTGNRYRFGQDVNTKVRRVYNVDIPALEALGYFRRLEGAINSGTLEPLAVQELSPSMQEPAVTAPAPEPEPSA